MKYKNELKSVVALSIPGLIGSIIGSTVIPYILFKDDSRVVLKIVGSFIGVSLYGIVKFIADIKKCKKSIAN